MVNQTNTEKRKKILKVQGIQPADLKNTTNSTLGVQWLLSSRAMVTEYLNNDQQRVVTVRFVTVKQSDTDVHFRHQNAFFIAVI